MYWTIFLLILTFHQMFAQKVTISHKKDAPSVSIFPYFEQNFQDTSIYNSPVQSNQKKSYLENSLNEPISSDKRNKEKKSSQLFQHNKKD